MPPLFSYEKIMIEAIILKLMVFVKLKYSSIFYIIVLILKAAKINYPLYVDFSLKKHLYAVYFFTFI